MSTKNLIENFFSLSILRGYNALILLLAFPYLTRILGPEKYGLINFARTFIIYFLIFTEFGFNWSATRLVSINRSNTEEVNKILTSITILKVLLHSQENSRMLPCRILSPNLDQQSGVHTNLEN